MSAILLASEFFGAVKKIASLIPEFSERRKKEIAKETEKHLDLETKFNKMALEFKVGSRSDELLGLADAVNAQDKKIRNLYVIYAKELRG